MTTSSRIAELEAQVRAPSKLPQPPTSPRRDSLKQAMYTAAVESGVEQAALTAALSESDMTIAHLSAALDEARRALAASQRALSEAHLRESVLQAQIWLQASPASSPSSLHASSAADASGPIMRSAAIESPSGAAPIARPAAAAAALRGHAHRMKPSVPETMRRTPPTAPGPASGGCHLTSPLACACPSWPHPRASLSDGLPDTSAAVLANASTGLCHGSSSSSIPAVHGAAQASAAIPARAADGAARTRSVCASTVASSCSEARDQIARARNAIDSSLLAVGKYVSTHDRAWRTGSPLMPSALGGLPVGDQPALSTTSWARAPDPSCAWAPAPTSGGALVPDAVVATGSA